MARYSGAVLPMPHLDLTRADHAYFFGFFQTDGHLYSGPGQKGAASIEVSAIDEPVLHAFSALFPTIYCPVTRRTRRTNFSEDHRGATWRARALSFRRELAALGIPAGKKSGIVAPPSVPYDVCGYLRGIVERDGSVGFTSTGQPFVSFVTASRALAEFFCEQLTARTGAVRLVKPNTRDGVYAPMVTYEPAVEMAAWLYPQGCLALDRKRAAAARVAAWTRPASMRARATRRAWTSDEDIVVLAETIGGAAAQLGRSESAVSMRRWRLRQDLFVKPEEVEEVMAQQTDLVEVVHRLRTIVCVKG